jgi:hypothetical protein
MRFRSHLVAACVVMVAAIWLSSGTMCPYASTWAFPIVSKRCGYLLNPDHIQYRAAFDMLDGAPRAAWEWSTTLRRILYPLLAFPFMKLAGYLVGGFLANVTINVAALIALASFVRKRWGDRPAIVCAWLLATYPGVMYWGAAPYPNAAIIPASCALFMLLTRLDEHSELKSVALNCAVMGLLFTTYDLLPFFGMAAMFVLIRRRRWRAMPIAAASLVWGPLAVWLVFTRLIHLDWSNGNSTIYETMVSDYLHPGSIGPWMRSLLPLPAVLAQVFLFSNLIFLPVLFLTAVILTRARLNTVEGALFVAVGLVFMFNNLGPPRPVSDQLRGVYIPRLYQPLGVALIVYCARLIGSPERLERGKARALVAALVLMVAGNLSIAFGPIARVPWAGNVYQRFYFHADLGTMDANLGKYGRRPLGFCQPQD